jgi:DegV family protein with EDD domain
MNFTVKQEDKKMSYRIIGDSGMDLTGSLKADPHFKLVPLTLMVDDISIKDDETFDQKHFIDCMKASPRCPKSACPSPQDFMKYFDYDGDIYVITLSSPLSGSYNSAELAKKLYLEDHPNKKIHIIDSHSASVGQTLIAMKIQELKEANYPFEKVVEKINSFRDGLMTKFGRHRLQVPLPFPAAVLSSCP